MSVAAINESAQYLTFRLGEETFALDVGKVREILDFTVVTKVPQTPPFMRGVINLRGSVVPVMDLRTKFGMTETVKTVDSCVIVVEMKLEDDLLVMGVLADAVQEVIDMAPEQIEPPPRIGSKLNTEFIFGMAKHDQQFIIILDIDRVFAGEEVAVAAQASQQAA
ncbi:chemotaxis protein CheW [Geomonas sp. Red32]|uniref:chemotaxis protein CheW n=1 Tax=Geomonas sp. Red32 TaxID=2912856 RepID=UPI00202CB431|nr:chemotaxis protein CheW [Geomonas sp. Red32]MCM0082435.1 chemotaxis protein CheW [Geomonas sp. Red32]